MSSRLNVSTLLTLPHGFSTKVEQIVLQSVEALLGTKREDGLPVALDDGPRIGPALVLGPIDHLEHGLQEGMIGIDGQRLKQLGVGKRTCAENFNPWLK